MLNQDTCGICGLPLRAAMSGMPLLAGAVAGSVAGCMGRDCSPARRIFRGMLTLGLTAAGTAGLRVLKTRVCQGHDEGSDEEATDDEEALEYEGLEDENLAYDSLLQTGLDYEGQDPEGLEKGIAYEGPEEGRPYEGPEQGVEDEGPDTGIEDEGPETGIEDEGPEKGPPPSYEQATQV
jgi:hypothetical protein